MYDDSLASSCAGLEPASCQPRVSIPLVAEVIGEVYGARMVGGTQDTFPLQQKMAICTLLMLVRGKALKEVELGKVCVQLPSHLPFSAIVTQLFSSN